MGTGLHPTEIPRLNLALRNLAVTLLQVLKAAEEAGRVVEAEESEDEELTTASLLVRR